MKDRLEEWFNDHVSIFEIIIILFLVGLFIASRLIPDGCEAQNAGNLSCRVKEAEENGCELPTPILSGYGEITNEEEIEGELSKCGY